MYIVKMSECLSVVTGTFGRYQSTLWTLKIKLLSDELGTSIPAQGRGRYPTCPSTNSPNTNKKLQQIQSPLETTPPASDLDRTSWNNAIQQHNLNSSRGITLYLTRRLRPHTTPGLLTDSEAVNSPESSQWETHHAAKTKQHKQTNTHTFTHTKPSQF